MYKKLRTYLIVNKNDDPIYDKNGRLSFYLSLASARAYIKRNKISVELRGQKRRIIKLSIFYE